MASPVHKANEKSNSAGLYYHNCVVGCLQGGTYRPPHAAFHSMQPSNNHTDNHQALQQDLLSHQPAGPSFVAQPVTAQQHVQHLQAAQPHNIHAIVPNPSGNSVSSWQQLLLLQQEQNQQLLALLAAQQATPPAYSINGPALQPGSYPQPIHYAPYSADPAQQWHANILVQQAPVQFPVTPLQYAQPPSIAPVLGADNGSVLPHPAPVEPAQHLPPAAGMSPANFPNAETARAHYLAPAAPSDVPSCAQTGLQMRAAPADYAAQQQAAASVPMQAHANQQPNFFAALWDGMRSAGAAALCRQQPRSSAPPPPAQVPRLLYPESY